MDPFPAWLRKLWDEWDIRVVILSSLSLQMFLIFFGGRRKNVRGIWIRILVWCAYLMADWVAVVALGKLSDVATHQDSDTTVQNNNALMSLWAPLLLLHLGGPDTITAYSAEDVKLWLRHVLGVLVHVFLVIYVFLRFWAGGTNWLTLLTFPLFLAGIIKYCERSWVLWCVNSVYPQPLLPIQFDEDIDHIIDDLSGDHIHSDTKLLVLAYLWLQGLAPCLAGSAEFDSRLTSTDVSKTLVTPDAAESFFKLLEFQTGFMFDVLYTKATRIYTTAGCILRALSFFFVATVLTGFVFIVKRNDVHKYSKMDIYITYILLGGAAVLEVYAIALVILSDWAILLMGKHCKMPLVRPLLRFLAPLVLNHGKRWSNSAAQLNLLTVLLYQDKVQLLHPFLKLFKMDHKFNVFMCGRSARVDIQGLKSMVFDEVRVIFKHFNSHDTWHSNFTERGKLTMARHENHEGELQWTINKEFDSSILMWHIVTTCCYYLDQDAVRKDSIRRTSSKLMSDYMLHLLVNNRDMLGHVRDCRFSVILSYYGQIMTEKIEGSSHDKAKLLCRKILESEPNVCTTDDERGSTRVKKGRSYEEQSVEYGTIAVDARDLAKTLMGEDYKHKKWEIISQVWVEMLCHGATRCKLEVHLDQLRRGGELLSQIWLLLTMHGLTGIDPNARDLLRTFFANS